MRKVILQEFVTLDGLAAGPDGAVDFIPASTRGDKSFGQEQSALLDTVDTMLLGRVTYLMFSSYWPSPTEGEDKVFADKLNRKRKLVFSQTLERAPWGEFEEARIVRNRPADEVPGLKRESGGDMIVWGSLSLARDLIAARLVDEYRLVICPVVLATGKPLFTDRLPSLQMRLLDAKAHDLGAVRLAYAPR
jgi:dihydrofolate reductase